MQNSKRAPSRFSAEASQQLLFWRSRIATRLLRAALSRTTRRAATRARHATLSKFGHRDFLDIEDVLFVPCQKCEAKERLILQLVQFDAKFCVPMVCAN